MSGRCTVELSANSLAEGGHGRGVAVGPWPSFPTDCWLRLLLLLVEWGGLKTVPNYSNLENLMSRTCCRWEETGKGGSSESWVAVARSRSGHLAQLPDRQCCYVRRPSRAARPGRQFSSCGP